MAFVCLSAMRAGHWGGNADSGPSLGVSKQSAWLHCFFFCWCNGTPGKHSQSERTMSNDKAPPCADYHKKYAAGERGILVVGYLTCFWILLLHWPSRQITLARIRLNFYFTLAYFALFLLPSVSLVGVLPADHCFSVGVKWALTGIFLDT